VACREEVEWDGCRGSLLAFRAVKASALLHIVRRLSIGILDRETLLVSREVYSSVILIHMAHLIISCIRIVRDASLVLGMDKWMRGIVKVRELIAIIECKRQKHVSIA